MKLFWTLFVITDEGVTAEKTEKEDLFNAFNIKHFFIYGNFLKEIVLSPRHDQVDTIHASFIWRRWLTRFQMPKSFLGLRI